ARMRERIAHYFPGHQAGREGICSHDPFELPVGEVDVRRALVASQSGKPAEQQRVRGQVAVCALPPKLFAHRVEVPDRSAHPPGGDNAPAWASPETGPEE